jgi:DNA-binding IclR family transcriptional regulator
MSSMADPVYGADGDVVAMLIVAGPMARLTQKRMLAPAPSLLETARERSKSSHVSPMLKAARKSTNKSAPAR